MVSAVNLTFGEDSGVLRAEQPSDLHTAIHSLKNKIAFLEKELMKVKTEV